MRIKTILHWREMLRWAIVCLVLVPLNFAALVWVLAHVVTMHWAVYLFAGIAVGAVATTLYRRSRPPLYHFDVKR